VHLIWISCELDRTQQQDDLPANIVNSGSFNNESDIVVSREIDPMLHVLAGSSIDDIYRISFAGTWCSGIRKTRIIIPVVPGVAIW